MFSRAHLHSVSDLHPRRLSSMTHSREEGAATQLISREDTVKMRKAEFKNRVKAMQLEKLRQGILSHTSNFSDKQFVSARDGATSLGQISFSICLQQLREKRINKKNN